MPIHYESFDHGLPFFTLHGSPGDHRAPARDLERTFRRRRGWRRIDPDIPGRGLSPRPLQISDMDGNVGAVERFTFDLAGKCKIVLGGTSIGAYVALALARRRPRRVAGLLLSVPQIHHSPRQDQLDEG